MSRRPLEHVSDRSLKKAIKALEAAYEAMGALADFSAPADDGRIRLRADIREYLEYCERVYERRLAPAEA